MKEGTQEKPQNGARQPRFAVNGQYIKDISFENPRAPASLMALKEKPQIDLGLDLKAHKLQENAYEVQMQISVKAKAENNPLFVVDLTYCGIFTLMGVDEKEVEKTILTECPNVMFPFARRIVADVVRDGGFPPFMLEPLDFGALYEARKNQDGAGGKKAAAS